MVELVNQREGPGPGRGFSVNVKTVLPPGADAVSVLPTTA